MPTRKLPVLPDVLLHPEKAQKWVTAGGSAHLSSGSSACQVSSLGRPIQEPWKYTDEEDRILIHMEYNILGAWIAILQNDPTKEHPKITTLVQCDPA